MSFKTIQDNTHCIFSKTSKIQYFEKWDSSKPFTLNLTVAAKSLFRFTEEINTTNLDGFTLEVKIECKTLDELAFLTNRILFYITQNDPQNFILVEDEIKREGWNFYFNGTKLHILTFASCYSENHPRNNFGQTNTYLLFQPDSAFERKRDRTGKIPETQKELIRKKFFSAGKPYDIELSKSDFTAYKFVKPQKIGDPLVKWWTISESTLKLV